MAPLTDFLSRFAAATEAENPPSFQMLFRDLVDVASSPLTAALRDQHPTLAQATAEIWPMTEIPAESSPVQGDGPPAAIVGLISWAGHAVKLLGFDAPMPASVVQGCLQPALMPPEMKAQARDHRAHVLLYYAGPATDAIEQRVALGLVAGALAHFGAMVTLNEEARAAVPSFALLPEDPGEDMVTTLRQLPLPYFYAGFVRMNLSETPGMWVRTFAAHRLGLPDLAFHARQAIEGERVFHILSAILSYLQESGLPLETGELMKVDDQMQLSVREPTLMEWWLESPGKLWVLEPVTDA